MKNNADLLPTVIAPYQNWADKKLATECNVICTAMTNNPAFPFPEPNMTDYNTAVMNFIAQLGEAATRDVNAIALKNTRRNELIRLTIALGNSIALTANGDLDMLISSAIPLRRRRQTATLGAPENLRIINGLNPGELVLKLKRLKHAKSFLFEYTMEPVSEQSVWTRTCCTTSRCIIKGLEGGKKYWFKAGAIGGKQQLVWGETKQSPFVQ